MAVPRRYLTFAWLGGLIIAISAHADNTVEGVVQLPPPTVERALTQRYGTNVEAPVTPSNPPAAVVYLEGNFPTKPKETTTTAVAMRQKNMLFAPDLLAVHVGGAVAFPNLDDTYHNVFPTRRRSGSISAATARMRSRLPSFSINPAWYRSTAKFTIACGGRSWS